MYMYACAYAIMHVCMRAECTHVMHLHDPIIMYMYSMYPATWKALLMKVAMALNIA